MKRIALSIAAAIASLLVFHDSYRAQSASTIEGIVKDAASGQPLAGVQVGLSSRGVAPVAYNPPGIRVPPTSAITDSQGRFSIETKESGRFRVVPTRDGYIYSRPDQKRAPAEPGVWVQISAGQRIQNLELRMARPAVISGKVLDSQGRPIVGTAGSVTLMRYTYGTDGNRTLGWIPGISYPGTAGSFQRMNDQGEFRFYDLPPGEYYLSVSGGSTIGSPRAYFYPGVTDESKAIPIQVLGGEDIRLETLTLTPRQKGVEVKLRMSGAALPLEGGRRVYIADSMLVLTRLQSPDEVLMPSVAPGRYDIVVLNDSIVRSAPLFYGRATVDVGLSNVEQTVAVQPGARVTGKMLMENEVGERSPAPGSVGCQIRSRHGLSSCASAQVVPGPHELELSGLPAGTYLLSAKIGDKDALSEGLDIPGDTELEIVLGASGGLIQGTVRDATGNTLPDAVVALVPDAPRRKAGPLYQSVITDPNGKFEIHGIAPGSYKLFAWPELEGLAYRNAEFMKEFEDRGKPVKVEKGVRLAVDLTAF